MTETPAAGSPGGPVSDRMQALLSAAAEEQVREQRAVSTVLGDLRGQVAALAESVRGAASEQAVDRLGGVVSTVVSDLRTSTSLLGQRIEALSKRVDAVAADTAGPTEQAAVRLTALAADIAAQGELVERMSAALDTLAGFPTALASLQQDVVGLHDRLQPLTEVRSGLSDLSARTAHSLEQLDPQLQSLQAKLDAIGTVPDTGRLRDAVVDALGGRLDKLEEAAERPVVGPEALRAGFGDLRAALDTTTGQRFEGLAASLTAIEQRLGQVGERVADVGDAAGGVPAVAAELARLHARVDDLAALREAVGRVDQGVAALRDDGATAALALGLAGLREDVEHLGEQLQAQAPPSQEEVAALVSQRVADRLVETLAPRIADVVLTRVSAALVTQLGEALSPRVRTDTEAIVRSATAESERRVLAHVDEAVLALAEALLRRRRGGRSGQPVVEPAATPPTAPPSEPHVEPPAEASPEQPQPPVEEVLDRLNEPAPAAPPAAADSDDAPEEAPAEQPEEQPEPPAVPDARPAVTSSLAPPPASAPAAPPPPAAAEPAAEEPTAEEPTAEEPAAEEPDQGQAAAEPATGGVPEPAKRVAKPPAKAPLKKAAAPAKKATRPPSRPPARPLLERTPDVPNDAAVPVRPRPRNAVPPATPPVAAPPPPAPPPPAPPAAPAEEPAPKRKPWWRPGG